MVLHQDSGSRPNDKQMQALGNRAHHTREVTKIPRKMVKQNPRMTDVHQAVRAANQPRSEQVRRKFLKKMKLISGISMRLGRFIIQEESLMLN